MKRWTLRILILLVLGAIVNVAVAWGGAHLSRDIIREDFKGSTNTSIPDVLLFERRNSTCDFVDVYSRWRVIERFIETSGPIQFRVHSPVCDRPEVLDAASRWSAEACGWPVRALWHEYVFENFTASEVRGGFIIESNKCKACALPYRPIWPGFAINTVFYAAVLFMIFLAISGGRRAVRLRRGRCPKCAYDLRGTPGSAESSGGGGCPECGWGRTP